MDVSNFAALLGEPAEGTDEDMLRRLHLYAREVTRVVEDDFDAVKVHFQGPRLHAISYRPVNDDAKMIAKAVVAAAALRHTAVIFNDVFGLDEDSKWETAAGIAFGEVIATKNGVGGDRELLFLGAPANYAAKMIRSGIRIATDAADLLPEDIQSYVWETSDRAIRALAMTISHVESLCEEYEWAWTAERTRNRLEEAARTYQVGCAKVTKPIVEIDKSLLGLSNSKRLVGVSIFADVDGFTKFIDDAVEDDVDLVEAMRAFHTLRSEMRDTAVVDFDALRVQYQGDRMQAIAYLPLRDDARAALTAIRIAAALQSVARHVMPQVVDESAAKPLAIGLSVGPILLSKLGEHGERDVVALGPSVEGAASIQQRLDGDFTGIDKALYDLLPAWAQAMYKYSGGAYVADDLTLDELERHEEAASASRVLKSAPALIRTQPPNPTLLSDRGQSEILRRCSSPLRAA